MVLKIDIEGMEWDVFTKVGKEIELFDQIIVEMHEILNKDNMGNVINGIKQITKTHFAVHIHGNNYGTVNYCKNLVTPETIEVTFLRKNKCSGEQRLTTMLPKEEDNPRDPKAGEIIIGYWNP